jgi:16S rRNA (cytosine1407-C5)-methyltransferase
VAEHLGNLVEHFAGLFYIQEASSMLPPMALAFNNDLNLLKQPCILDMAAAPGSKTTQLAALMNNSGTLVANELSSSRLASLHYNLQRCGVVNTCLSHFDGAIFGEYSAETFDAILLDAPCGGEGTIRKDPNALKNWNHDALASISTLQKSLIDSAYHALKPGGRLVYSTCTLSHEENQAICDYLLSQYSDTNVVSLQQLFNGADKAATREGYLHVFPHVYNSEGFFVAAFDKAGDLTEQLKNAAPKKWPLTKLSAKQLQQLIAYFNLQFKLDISKLQNRLWLKQDTVWLLPPGAVSVANTIKLNRPGIKVAKLEKNRVETDHDFTIGFGDHAGTNKIDLSSEQAVDYFMGKDIELTSSQFELLSHSKGESIVTYLNSAIGLAKIIGNKLKNKLPRPLVRDNVTAL